MAYKEAFSLLILSCLYVLSMANNLGDLAMVVTGGSEEFTSSLKSGVHSAKISFSRQSNIIQLGEFLVPSCEENEQSAIRLTISPNVPSGSCELLITEAKTQNVKYYKMVIEQDNSPTVRKLRYRSSQSQNGISARCMEIVSDQGANSDTPTTLSTNAVVISPTQQSMVTSETPFLTDEATETQSNLALTQSTPSLSSCPSIAPMTSNLIYSTGIPAAPTISTNIQATSTYSGVQLTPIEEKDTSTSLSLKIFANQISPASTSRVTTLEGDIDCTCQLS